MEPQKDTKININVNKIKEESNNRESRDSAVFVAVVRRLEKKKNRKRRKKKLTRDQGDQLKGSKDQT